MEFSPRVTWYVALVMEAGRWSPQRNIKGHLIPEKEWRQGDTHRLSFCYVPIYYSIQFLRQPHELRTVLGGKGRFEKSGA